MVVASMASPHRQTKCGHALALLALLSLRRDLVPTMPPTHRPPPPVFDRLCRSSRIERRCRCRSSSPSSPSSSPSSSSSIGSDFSTDSIESPSLFLPCYDDLPNTFPNVGCAPRHPVRGESDLTRRSHAPAGHGARATKEALQPFLHTRETLRNPEMPPNHGTTALGSARPYQRPAVRLSAATSDMTAQLQHARGAARRGQDAAQGLSIRVKFIQLCT